MTRDTWFYRLSLVWIALLAAAIPYVFYLIR